MPKSPHSSWNLSSRHVVLKTAPPGVVDRFEAYAHDPPPAAMDDEPLATGRPDPPPRHRGLRHQRFELPGVPRLHADDHARWPLAEEHNVGSSVALQFHLAPDRRRSRHTALRERHRQPAFRAI